MGEKQNRRPAYTKKQADARRAARRAAREAVLALLFETEYHAEDTAEAIYLRAAEARDEDMSDRYIRKTYMGIMENIEAIDELIGHHATGWRTSRLSRVCRAVLRLGTYELVYDQKIPAPIAINEAVELAKKYDDPKSRAFVNGVLNAIKDELGRADVADASEAETEAAPEAEPELEMLEDGSEAPANADA